MKRRKTPRRQANRSGAALEALIDDTAAAYAADGLAHIERSPVRIAFKKNGETIPIGTAAGDFIGAVNSRAVLIECKYRPNLWITAAGNPRKTVDLAKIPTKAQRNRMDLWAKNGAYVALIIQCDMPDLQYTGAVHAIPWNVAKAAPIIQRQMSYYIAPVRRCVYDILGLYSR